MAGNSAGIEVYPDKLNDPDTPWCEHGPTLLFERCGFSKGSMKKFFACGACRDRKHCNFFQWEDDKKSKKVQQALKKSYEQRQSKTVCANLYQRREVFICLQSDERLLCTDCGLLVLQNEKVLHEKHDLKTIEDIDDLATPTFLLPPLENNRSNAQYLFSENTLTLVTNLLKKLGFNKVLCIGTPRVHEAIQKDKEASTRSLLLDMDHRLAQFFPPSEFCRYNMFNHHFFEGKTSKKTYVDFLKVDGKLVVLIDPPFGGLIKVLAHTIQQISVDLHNVTSGTLLLPFLLFLPYFMESKVQEHLRDTNMIDYKVDYSNHGSFHSAKVSGGKKGSPVRMFTNLSLKNIPLPSAEGYKYCKICERWVASENKHCNSCNQCTSKDGRTYQHCEECKRCVKPSYTHCFTCNQCLLLAHKCGQTQSSGCFVCGDVTHKKIDCPHTDGKSKKRHKVSNKDGSNKRKRFKFLNNQGSNKKKV